MDATLSVQINHHHMTAVVSPAAADAWVQRALDIHTAVTALRHEWAAEGFMIESEPCLLGPRTLEPTYVFYHPSCSLRTLVVIPNMASRMSLLLHSAAAAGAQKLVLLVRVRATAQRLREKRAAMCSKHTQGCGNALGVELDVRTVEDLLERTQATEVGLCLPMNVA